MAYGYSGFQSYNGATSYQPASGYGTQYVGYQFPRNDFQPQFAQQPGTLFARFVSGREEAIAAQVLPDGNTNVFLDSTHGRIYTKKVDPQNGAVDFREYVDSQPVISSSPDESTPQVTLEMFMGLKNEVEQLKQMNVSQFKRGGKADVQNDKSYTARANDS